MNFCRRNKSLCEMFLPPSRDDCADRVDHQIIQKISAAPSISGKLLILDEKRGIIRQNIPPGRPRQNACIARNNRAVRHELLSLLHKALHRADPEIGVPSNSSLQHNEIGCSAPKPMKFQSWLIRCRRFRCGVSKWSSGPPWPQAALQA